MAGRKRDTARDAWPDKVRAVASTLDGLLSELESSVEALRSILPPPPDGQAPDAVEVVSP